MIPTDTRFYLCLLIILAALMVAYCYGVISAKKRFFPYPLIERLVKSNENATDTLANRFRRSIFQSYTQPSDIIFLGDSLVENAPWNEMFPNLRVGNRGIGGESFFDMRSRINDVIEKQPNIVIIIGGINSAGIHSIDNVLSDLKFLIDELRQENIDVIICSTIETRGHRKDFVRQLNAEMPDFARQNEVQFIDLSDLADEGGLQARYTFDGTHLNGKGYRALEDLLAPVVHRSLGVAEQ